MSTGGTGGGRARAALALLVLAVALTSFEHVSRAAGATVLHVSITGVINPIKARYLKQALERARAERVAVVLVSIDTPGGLVSSMQEIVADLTNASVPVVGLVEPQASQATSAGAFILLAMDVAAMVPGTRMGAAHPVGASGALEGAVEEKATNSLASLARSLALRRGRPEKTAELLVRESRSYTAEEAKHAGLIELVVRDREELLSKLHGYELRFADRSATLATRGAGRVELPLPWSSRLLDRLADPTLASLLLSIGVLGILYELATPGVAVGGIVGVTSLLLGLLAMSVLPLKIAGALLIIAGALALAVEVKVQAHGLVGVAGLVAMLLGALTLVDETRYFGAPQRVDPWVFVPVVAVLGLGLVALVGVAARTLSAPLSSGIEALPGARGVARTTFVSAQGRFTGDVFADGARWSSVADTPIAEGDIVEIVAVLNHPTRLEVRPLHKAEKEEA